VTPHCSAITLAQTCGHVRVRVLQAAEHDDGVSAGQALVDKAPMVAGAIKTIDEVKKMARNSESSHEHASSGKDSFFKNAFTGWGDKKKLEEGWKLTHGQETVHTSASVRAAEEASNQAAR
jgi:hypothetical protein